MKIPHTIKLCGLAIACAVGFILCCECALNPAITLTSAILWVLLIGLLVVWLSWKTVKRAVREFRDMWKKL